MRRIQFGAVLLFVPLLCLAAILPLRLLGKSKATSKPFVIDPNKPFVYVRFDHIGPGEPRSDDEPPERIWLHLVNNCRVPIVITANGVPDESPKDEVGLRYKVVANPPTLGSPRLIGKPSEAKAESDADDDSAAEGMPRNDLVDVMSAISIEPVQEILFSMPFNHVGKHWHVEIPFEFDLPRGNCCRDERNGGMPVMRVDYGLYDLPPEVQTQISPK